MEKTAMRAETRKLTCIFFSNLNISIHCILILPMMYMAGNSWQNGNIFRIF